MYTKYAKTVKVGTVLMHKELGMGVCTKVDLKSEDFRYCFKFEDGTVKWMSDDACAKMSAH